MNRRQFLFSLLALPLILKKFKNKTPNQIGVQIPELKSFFHKKTPYSLDTLISFLAQNQIRLLKFPFHWELFYPHGIGILNQQAIQFYHNFLDTCIQNHITPWALCYQNQLPAPLLQNHSDWTQKTTPLAFQNYISTLVRHFHKKIQHWSLFENLMLEAILGYLSGQKPPHHKGTRPFLTALSHMLNALSSSFRLIKQVNPDLQVGFSETFFPILLNPYDSQLAYSLDLLLNRLTFELTSGYSPPTSVFPALKQLPMEKPYTFLINPDFHGINFSHALELQSNKITWIGDFPMPFNKNSILSHNTKDYDINAFFNQVKQLTFYLSIKKLILTGHTISLPTQINTQYDEQRKHLLKLFFNTYQKVASPLFQFHAYFYTPLYDEQDSRSKVPNLGIAFWENGQLKWKESGKFLAQLLTHASSEE